MTISADESQELVRIVNQYPLGVDEGIPPLRRLEDLEVHAEGPLLYPCSGSDVGFPIRLFPDIDTFVLVDEHPVFTGSFADTVHDLVEVGKAKSFKSGFGVMGNGYDFTSVHSTLMKDNEVEQLNFHSRAVEGFILLRLRKLCGMTLMSIKEELPGLVCTIKGNIEGREKTVHYVSHYFGQETSAYDWLAKQNFQFQTLFVKAFAPSIGGEMIERQVFSQIQTLLRPSLLAKKLTVISDASIGYTLNEGLPSLLDPRKILKQTPTTYAFGYGNSMVIADGGAVYQDYPDTLLLELQRNAEKVDRLHEEDKARKKRIEEMLSSFTMLSSEEKWSSLTESCDISVDNETLTVRLDERSPYLQQMTASTIADILAVSKARGCTSLEVNFLPSFNNVSYQLLAKDIITQLDSVGAHVTTLSIKTEAKEETSFLSECAIPAAKALAIHGRNLTHLNVKVNDKGALAFKDTALKLSRDGTLKKFSIHPIQTWRSETTLAMSEAMAVINNETPVLTASSGEMTEWTNIRMDNETLTIRIRDLGIPYDQQLTLRTIAEALAASKRRGCTALKINFAKPFLNFEYQLLAKKIISQLDSDGTHLTKLSIETEAQDETSFLSQVAVPTAQALTSHGRYLTDLNVRVNDNGALAFKDTALQLAREGNLKRFSIRPIQTWRPETTSSMPPLTSPSRSSGSLWPAGKDRQLEERGASIQLQDRVSCSDFGGP